MLLGKLRGGVSRGTLAEKGIFELPFLKMSASLLKALLKGLWVSLGTVTSFVFARNGEVLRMANPLTDVIT